MADPLSKNALDRGGHSLPLRRFVAQLALAGLREPVELRLTVVLDAAPPLGVDPPGPFEPMQRRVERALVHPQHVLGDLLDALRDGPPVHRACQQGAQDQQVERALQQVEA